MLTTITEWNVSVESGFVRVEWGSAGGKRWRMDLTELEALRFAHQVAKAANEAREVRANDPRAQVT